MEKIKTIQTMLQTQHDALNNRQRLKSILLDFFPADKLTVNMFLMAYDEGILSKIEHALVVDELMLNTFINVLVSNYGVTNKTACDVIKLVAGVFNKTVKIPNNSKDALSITDAQFNKCKNDAENADIDADTIDSRRKELLRDIRRASEHFNSHSAVPGCFEYEIETGVETQYGKTVFREEIRKYVGAGIRITGYNGFNAESIVIPEEIEGLPVISIGEEAFINIEASEITLPPTIKIIMRGAFEGCKNLKHIALPKDIEILRESCFSTCGLTRAYIPNGVRVIPERCFCLCRSLSQVYLGDNIREIHSWAFWHCAITELMIPNSTKFVAHDIFAQKLATYEKANVVCAFLGEETEISIPSYETFNKVSTIYCLPGSRAQATARKHNIPVKDLYDFLEL